MAMSQLNLSAKGCHRVLKLARTLTDLVGSEGIQSVHLAEVLHMRQDYLFFRPAKQMVILRHGVCGEKLPH